MPVPTNRQPGELIQADDVNAIATLANTNESGVNSLTTAVADKSDVGHTHLIADTSNLQSTLDGKAPALHVHNASTVFNTGVVPASRLPNATSSAQGVVELANNIEVNTGTDTTRAVTPAGFRYAGDQRYAQFRFRQSFTPTFTPAPTAWGNSSRQGYYLVTHENMVFISIRIVIGTTFTAGAGSNISIPLPHGALFGMEFVLSAHLISSAILGGNGEGMGDAKIETAGTDINRIYIRENSTTSASLETLSHTSGWAAGDRLLITGLYMGA